MESRTPDDAAFHILGNLLVFSFSYCTLLKDKDYGLDKGI